MQLSFEQNLTLPLCRLVVCTSNQAGKLATRPCAFSQQKLVDANRHCWTDNSHMDDPQVYVYSLSGRRPGTILASGLFAAMLAIGLVVKAPWFYFLPLALGGLISMWAIWRNPKSGSTLTASALTFFNRSDNKTIFLADIASMKVQNWTDGPDTVVLNLRSGMTVHIPSLCADSKLAVALRAQGVPDS
jgi:hypothetical protein